MYTYKKGQMNITAIVVTLIIVVGIVAIFALIRKTPAPSEEPIFVSEEEVVEPETADLQTYQDDELGFSFEFSEKYGSIKTFENVHTGEPMPLINPGTTGEMLRGYISFEDQFYFAGVSEDYTAERGGDIGEIFTKNCGPVRPDNEKRVTKNGDEYYFNIFEDDSGYYGGGSFYLAHFTMESSSSRFPCLNFTAKVNLGLSEAEFLEIMDSVSIY